MVFSSVLFVLVFLPLFFTLYWLVPQRFKNLLLLGGSVLFYSWGAPLFIFVILGTTLLDFHLVKWMHASQNAHRRRWLLVLSVSMNLGLLFYFKYALFAIENLNMLLRLSGNCSIVWEEIALPIGISFFTFESLTYVVDVYRGVHAPLRNFWQYQLYIIAFPKLIAGPIVRYHDIADQITQRFATDSAAKKLSGLQRFILGLGKKVLLANVMAEAADDAFNAEVASLSTASAWLGILCYTLQIYFDFSGYSDMAIGLMRMLGFNILENFNQPYIATSVTDFWRRWHISLGNWMRNYLYIPLGGNRVSSNARLYFNLWLVFLASGIWHGASWSFVVWGAYHGFWLVAERAFLLRWSDAWWKPLRIVLTFFAVLVGWVFFRAETLQQAFVYLQKMFVFSSGLNVIISSPHFIFHLLLAVVLSFVGAFAFGRKLTTIFYEREEERVQTVWYNLLYLLLLLLSVSQLAAEGFNPFIYFRF